MTAPGTVFAVVFVALYVGHHVGDHWTQTHGQACGKGERTAAGRRLCLAHVASLTMNKLAALVLALTVTGVTVPLHWAAGALLVDAASHYWADRRFTLAALAEAIGKGGYYQLGQPRPGRDDNPSVGTGAFHLDQSWHLLWLFFAALAITAGAAL